MEKYQNNVTDPSGNVIANQLVFINIAGTGTLATIYSDNGITQEANPIRTDRVGYFEFYAADGRYDILVGGGGYTDVIVADLVTYEANQAGSSGSSLVGFIQAGTGAIARTAQDKLRELVSVKDFGAIGDGSSHPLSTRYASLAIAQALYPFVTSLAQEIDWAAIQAAINYTKTKGWQRRVGVPGSQQGGGVFFPSGAYFINSPIVLPRSGVFDGSAVALVGENMTSTVLLGAETFPANRGMVEWEAVASRVYYQTLQELTFLLPRTVSGVMAVNFVPVNGSTSASLFLEAMHGLQMRRIEVDATNTVNSYAIKFDGYVRYSEFDTIRANFALGSTPTFNTVLLQFPENTGTTASIYGESNGAGYCTFNGIYGMGEQGGGGAIMRGRFYECTVNQVLCGNHVIANAPSIGIIKSLATRFTELNIEGGVVQTPAEVQVQDSQGITITELGLGGPGTGNTSTGISLVNCKNCLIDGRYTDTSSTPFSLYGGYAISVDATSTGNVFKRFAINAAVTAEVQILAPASARNVVEWYNSGNGLYGDIGLRPGYLLATADSNATQTIPTGTFTPLVFGSETLDPLNVYNPATGLLTVPVSGRYRITAIAQIGTSIVASKQLDLQVSVNGAAGAYITRVFTGAETFDSLRGSVVVNVTAGQTLGVGVMHNFGANATLSQFGSTSNIAFEFVD